MLSPTNGIFDVVVAFNILKFTHHEGWCDSKPFLISQSFKTVMESEEFAKHYLINWFELSEEEINRLETFGLEFGRNWSTSTTKIKDHSMDSVEEQPQKKRKIGNTNEIVIEQYSPPQTMNEILKMFTKLSYQVNTERIKSKIIDELHSYKRGLAGSGKTFSNMKELFTYMENDELIAKSFKRFGKSSLDSIETREREFTIRNLTVRQIFGSVKEMFFLKHYEEELVNDLIYNNDLIVFTSIGYPLLLKSTFVNGAYFRQSETLKIYSHELFHNEKKGTIGGHTYSQNHNKDLLASLKTVLLSETVNQLLVQNGVNANQLEDVKNCLIYNFLELSFGSFNSSFKLDSSGWIPFIGKVRAFDSDIESDSSEESDSE